MKMCKISIALCTYNGSRFIKEQLQSIVDQTLSPNEIVICDDNSEDDTLLIINTFVRKYTKFTWVIISNKKRKGVRKNFEQAISLTTGDYIATCDQDDIWELEKLEILLKIIKEKKVALVHSNCSYIDKDGNFFDVDKKKNSLLSLKTYILYDNNVTGCTCVFDSCLKKILFPFPSHFYYHDHWLAIIAYNNGGIFYCDMPLVRYRQHDSNVVSLLGGGGMVSDFNLKYFWNKSKGFYLVLKKYKCIKYSWRIYLILIRQYITCSIGLAWIKYKTKEFFNK